MGAGTESPTILSCLQLTEQKRMLEGMCFACGAEGRAVGSAKCPKRHSPTTATVQCPECCAAIRVTTLGSTFTNGPKALRQPPPFTSGTSSSKAPEERKCAKRLREPLLSSTVLPLAKVQKTVAASRPALPLIRHRAESIRQTAPSARTCGGIIKPRFEHILV